MRLHLLGLFHTIPSTQYSHCAFTGRVLRFGRMMRHFGYEVIEYSNGRSESAATEHVQILDEESFTSLKELYKKEQPHEAASMNSTIYKVFCEKLLPKLKERVKDGDIICHPFGIAHAYLSQEFPNAYHVEIGIGYVQAFADFRIYETYQWWSWHQGKEQVAGNAFQWVCPMGYDTDEWNPCYTKGNYFLYMGRVIQEKGLVILREIAKHVPEERFVIIGEASEDVKQTFKDSSLTNLEYIGPVYGKDRSNWVREATAMLMPTLYCEPFGGAGVEGMLCGTPLIASDFGAFSETIDHGINGYRCKTLGDWCAAVRKVQYLNRTHIAKEARNKYCLRNVGAQMDKIFKQISTLKDKGWYDMSEISAIWS